MKLGHANKGVPKKKKQLHIFIQNFLLSKTEDHKLYDLGHFSILSEHPKCFVVLVINID